MRRASHMSMRDRTDSELFADILVYTLLVLTPLSLAAGCSWDSLRQRTARSWAGSLPASSRPSTACLRPRFSGCFATSGGRFAAGHASPGGKPDDALELGRLGGRKGWKVLRADIWDNGGDRAVLLGYVYTDASGKAVGSNAKVQRIIDDLAGCGTAARSRRAGRRPPMVTCSSRT